MEDIIIAKHVIKRKMAFGYKTIDFGALTEADVAFLEAHGSPLISRKPKAKEEAPTNAEKEEK